ncbi:MAG: 50S ribosomal protein L25 [Lentisphaeria bacterium]
MTEKLVLKAFVRELTGSANANRLRKEGKTPAVLYNEKTEAKNIVVDTIEASALINVHGVFALELDGVEVPVIIKDVQYNYLSGHTLHIDFMEVNMTHAVKTVVPVVSAGIPVGLSAGGQLVQNLHGIELKGLPGDMPEQITVDVTELSIGDSIMVKNVVLPAGVESVTGSEVSVFQVRA